MKMKSRGFTLVEVLVTVSIIAVLTSIGLAVYSGAQKKSRDARRKADLEAVRSALEIYRADNPAVGYPIVAGYNKLCCGLLTPLRNYLSSLPLDPINDAAYYYSYAGGGNNYTLCAAQLEQTETSYCLSPP